MAGHEFFEPADRKRPVADPTASEPLAGEDSRHACDPAFRHGVVVGFDGSTSSERALAYAIGMARRSGSGLIIVHVANRLPTTVWAGCEPPVFVDVPDHRTEVLGLELACADYLAEVPWILVERGGDICHELEEVGREYSADAIVVLYPRDCRCDCRRDCTHDDCGGLCVVAFRVGCGEVGEAGAAACCCHSMTWV